jgi:signal transduction histidine kinase
MGVTGFMKLDMPVPFEKLLWFREKLGLSEHDAKLFSTYRHLFIKKKEDFADKLYSRFWEIPETRIILEHEKRRGHLKKLWAQWFELLLQGHFEETLYARLWRSGLRHVEINIDKRFINLAYAFVRQFYQEIALSEIPLEERDSFLLAMDKIVDFCVLIETHAYVSATSQCDMEVVKGISHQMRNPLTVIGGNIIRLQRKLDPDSPMYKTYQAILMENKRLEAMVKDVVIYSEMFQKTATFSKVSLERIISKALDRLEDAPGRSRARVEIELDREHPFVQGDEEDLETMFYHLLQNCFEAADPEMPYVRIASKVLGPEYTSARIEILNNGIPPSQQDLDNLFVPFFSPKAYGTGFGLPIAQLAARRNLGDIFLEPVPGQGTKCIVQLPVPAV